MQTKLSKWGNSLALRLPASLAAEANLECGDTIEVRVEAGRLVLTPSRRVPTLEEMLASVVEGKTHGEVDWGKSVGNEVW